MRRRHPRKYIAAVGSFSCAFGVLMVAPPERLAWNLGTLRVAEFAMQLAAVGSATGMQASNAVPLVVLP